MTTKQFALSGVNEILELGKDGHKFDASNAGYIEVQDASGGYIRVKGAAAAASNEFVIQSQLDAVHALAGGYLAYGYNAGNAISQLAGQGSGDSGAILYGDTFKVTTSGTFLGATAEAGDLVTALVAGADTTDNTASNTDWMLIEIRTASDLADGVSTDHSSGKIIVKDAGVTEAKIATGAVTLSKMASDSVDSDQYVDRSVDGVHIALATILDENIANAVITKSKLAAAVQATLDKADAEHDTRTPNLETLIGGSLDLDSQSSIAAQTNYMTNTTIVGQLQQADARMKLDNDDNLLRKSTVTFDGGAQNIGASIKSGRAILRVSVTPVTVANGANCTMSIGISGNAAKYMKIADIDLYVGSPNSQAINLPLSSDEQIIATVTQGTATQGSFFVTVEHG